MCECIGVWNSMILGFLFLHIPQLPNSGVEIRERRTAFRDLHITFLNFFPLYLSLSFLNVFFVVFFWRDFQQRSSCRATGKLFYSTNESLIACTYRLKICLREEKWKIFQYIVRVCGNADYAVQRIRGWAVRIVLMQVKMWRRAFGLLNFWKFWNNFSCGKRDTFIHSQSFIFPFTRELYRNFQVLNKLR